MNAVAAQTASVDHFDAIVLPPGTAAAVAMVSCPSLESAERHCEQWSRLGGNRLACVSGDGAEVIVSVRFSSVFDVLLAVGAVAGGPMDGAGHRTAIVLGSIGAEDLTASECVVLQRVALILAMAKPGQCLLGAEVGLVAGSLLGPGLDLIDSGEREGVDRGSIVYDIRATDLASRVSFCPRLEWARRSVHGAGGFSKVEYVDPDLVDDARITCFVAEDEGSLQVAVARAALGAHARGAHVLRIHAGGGSGPVLSGVVQLISTYAHDRGATLSTNELPHEWAAISHTLPELASQVDVALSSGFPARRRYRNRGSDRLDLIDRLLRTIASNGPALIVATGIDSLDPLSQILLERVLGDQRLGGIRLVCGAVGQPPALVDRLRKRLGQAGIDEVTLPPALTPRQTLTARQSVGR